ncbi:sensor histidine kinase [Marinibaculum pumilum]|uniref:histidine kinase n=1 Tax=Marinibaculum pumilum TaxID=1766165 RepID=A0ABV7L1L9_9PROT
MSAGLRNAVEVEKLLQLNRNQLVAAIIGIINPLLLASVLWRPETAHFLAGWVLVGLAFCGLQLRAWWRNRHRPRPARAPRNLDLRVCLAAALGSLYWAVLPVVAIPQADEAEVLAVVIVVCGTGVGGAVLLSLVPLAAAIYFAITFVPTIAIVLARIPETPWLLALLIFNLFVFMTVTVQRLHQVFFTNWANAIETSRLAEEARAAERTKAEFVANMSHELRTPLNAINGFSEAMAAQLFGDLGSDRYRTYAQDIQASGHHLLEIINDLIDISRIEAGRYDLQKADVPVADVLELGRRLALQAAMAAGVELRVQVPVALSARLDRMAVSHVAMHVLLQAVRSAPSGSGVELSAAAGPDGALTIAVRLSDRVGPGPGAAAEVAGGPALGMQLAQALMVLHDGELVLGAPASDLVAEGRFPPGTATGVSKPG